MRRLTSAVTDLLHRPLLSPEAIAALAIEARHWTQYRSARAVHDHHAGDWPGAALGRGLDFEEARPYSPGDDLRDMDWRTTARLGHPFIKIYREERQPVFHLVIDRGPSMRFGTRTRLKSTQAARVATLAAFAANADNLAVSATLWDTEDRHLPPRHDRTSLLQLIAALTAATPPAPVNPHQHAPTQRHAQLDLRLHALIDTLTRGTRVWWISDFSALNDSHLPALNHLAHDYAVTAVQIQDRAESALPDIGPVRLHSMTDGRSLAVETHAQRAAYAHAQSARQAEIAALLQRVGIPLHRLDTEVNDLVAHLQRHA
jgi:uncharacterized protein (DUF58 family)